MYLLYGTPYLLVANGVNFPTALRQSIERGRRGGAYPRYGIGFLISVARLTLFVTLVVMNFGVVGLLAGLVVAVTLGFALNVATTGFVRALKAGRFDDSGSTPGGSPAPDGEGSENNARSDAGRSRK